MPQSSTVNIRDGALLAINGELEDIESICNQGFQEISARSAVSLVVKNNGTYSLIENRNKQEQWVIFKQQSIIAWTGYDIELSPKKIFAKWLSYQSLGKGYIVLSGDEELVEVDLKDKDQYMFINPGSLVATNGDISTITMEYHHNTNTVKQYLSKLLPSFKVPRMGIMGGIVKSMSDTWQTFIQPVTSSDIWKKMSRTSSTVYHWLKLNVYVRVVARPMYLKMVGPGKVLLDGGQLLKSNGYFSKQEILRAYEKKK
ncbi:uncharacterized protein KQ657_002291 [Scheffersomyces spartinae]|uniref:Altered inheritance of mitochondria protein 24, mitochondrial n=1 Tax=Scheffersomyces spartinae TaxID=45513 RepID=A0A9P7VDF4_9ASCO|nr:uncharacterized protein KQ657_002291 [Scheffersomyces spartinae]KAG7195906.1 hypothetical protein KQ657_002291 [Scheffersomyces spartinae]